MQLDDLLKLTMLIGASDLHLKAGSIPKARKQGQLVELQEGLGKLSNEDLETIIINVLDEEQMSHLKTHKDIDVAYGISGLGRFRLNIFKQRGSYRMVVRAIPDRVPTFENLNLPDSLKKLTEQQRGLVLITGSTGSGKSSTLAAMINYINNHYQKHIIMIEDPTEYLIKDNKSMITQRELGIDTLSFAQSLRAALRQDPDVILIGEMRDPETIETALQAAETGHLVLSTLHTLDAHETVNRILSAFDSQRQLQFRLQLASVLNAIISQRLVRAKDGTGFYPALEIMMNTKRIKSLIKDPRRTHEIHDAIESGKHVYGMQSFDQCLIDMIRKDFISTEEGLRHCSNPENFKVRLSGITSLDKQNSWESNTKIKNKEQLSWQELQELELEELDKTTTQMHSNVRMKGIDNRRKPSNLPPIPSASKKKKKS